MKRIFTHTYEDIISVENLLLAWREFLKGKKKKRDVQFFQSHLADNILLLHNDLKNKTYKHGGYLSFRVADPKPRDIHKASVRDRLLHHAIYRILYPFFDSFFIYDSFSCRKYKGTHRALNRFSDFYMSSSFARTKTVWVLKFDIKKFFANIDHEILNIILSKHIKDQDILQLLNGIINSFYSTREGVGLPLGNLTSQLLVNIYMNEFDRFIKHNLRVKYYIRYADDFVVFSQDKSYLNRLLIQIQEFLSEKLHLTVHPDKVYIKTIASGVDFLGWVHFPYSRILRTATKNKMIRKVKISQKSETKASYLGMLQHGNGHKIKKAIWNLIR